MNTTTCLSTSATSPSTGASVDEAEPRDRHSLSCPIWQSDDPADECDCFEDGVHRVIELYESHAPKQNSRAPAREAAS